MKKVINLLSSSLVCMALVAGILLSCDTKNNVDPPGKDYFVKYYGGDGDQTAVDLLVEQDGSIVLLGNSQSGKSGENKIYLVMTDAQGNLLWEKKLGTTKDEAKDIEKTLDGNYIILSDYVISETNVDFKLIKITPEGVVLDSAVSGSSSVEIAHSITAINDGGFIVSGSTSLDTTRIFDPNNTDDQSDIFHFRCNADLVFENILWKGRFGPGTFDVGTKVIQQSPGLFYVFGSTNLVHEGNPSGNLNLIYYSIDGGGVNGTPNYLGDFDNDTEASFVMQVPAELGGGYFVIGTESATNGTVSLHAVKLRSPLAFNSTNDEQFDREIAISNKTLSAVSAAAVIHSGQGYLLLANETRETGHNIWLTKIDQNGNQLWSASYGSEEEDDLGAAVHELDNGKIVIAGSVRLINNQYKMVLMKVNSEGHLMK
jgi:hypothetical protein